MKPHWTIHCGDILDLNADVLVCSANVYLNLSGGVGGAFLLRYGDEMQRALYAHLAARGVRHLPRGSVVAMPPFGAPYRAVLHAVAIDAFYQSTPTAVAETITESLWQAFKLEARTVAMTALATGYGKMTIADFASAMEQVLQRELPPLKQIVLSMRSSDDVDELLRLIPGLVPTPR